VSDPLAILRAELDALERAYSSGHHGRWSAHRRADLLDACLAPLWGRAEPPPGIALAALGGYGRRLQLPASDVDLLFVHDDVAPGELERVVQAVVYPLWDAGFVVGQAVRTPEGCVAIALERLDAMTAMLDARTLEGDADLVARAIDPVRGLAASEPLDFTRRVREAAAERRARFGSTAHLLEPDLKEGAGGLRDVASIGWLDVAIAGGLGAAGLLRGRERAALEEAEEFLVRVRSALHLDTGKRIDRLLIDHQHDIAVAMGFTDRPRLVATDGLMRSLFEHARQVEHVTSLVLDRMHGAAADGDPTPAVADVAAVGDLTSALEALASLAEADAAPPAALLDRIEQVDTTDPVDWTPALLGAFLRILRAGRHGTRMLEFLDRADLLSRLIPAWREVRCRPQRDPYHRFTVDAHLTHAVRHAANILAGEIDPDDPYEARAREAVDDVDAVLLGALLHDIGKVGEGNHVPIGAEIAAETLAHMGVVTASRDLATFMVADHLLLPDTATRRDLTDENLILDVAARVGTPARLAALYVLLKADAAATGPAAWTPWRRALIHELVTKVQHVLERGDMGQELAATLAERTGRLRDLLPQVPEAELNAFVLRMPRRYFLSVSPTQAARHLPTITPHVGSADVRTATAPGSRPGTYELLVVAQDRPGLLAWIAGSLAVGGISILSAEVFTTGDGVAIDLFEVEGAFEPEIGEGRWRRFRQSLRRAIDGSISIDRAVDEQRARYPAPRVRTTVTVHIDNEASDFSTVVEVGAPDRIGLLHDITQALAELQLDVHLAKVATYDGRVVDAFYVRDGVGRKITDPAQSDEIVRALRERLG